MAQELLANYKSRRNSASLVQTEAGLVVIKTFAQEEMFQQELGVYQLLRGSDLPCARVIRAQDKTLVLSQLPGRDLVECLQQQERMGQPVWEVWDKLVAWLTAFTHHTGLVMTDVNLRNFLYDENTKILYGLDFEQCGPWDMMISAARVGAHIRTYQPQHTPLKQEISQYVLGLFARNFGWEVDRLFLVSREQESMLLQRRKNRI